MSRQMITVLQVDLLHQHQEFTHTLLPLAAIHIIANRTGNGNDRTIIVQIRLCFDDDLIADKFELNRIFPIHLTHIRINYAIPAFC
jgi:hypothetical protein